eukprot:4454248-Lingulodinium_polyedra.AAC.1
MDSSPQAKRNWLMVGFSTMRLAGLRESTMFARHLWERRGCEDRESILDGAAAMATLQSRLAFQPAVPTI